MTINISCYVFNILISNSSFAAAGRTFTIVGPLSVSTKCGLKFKLLQFAKHVLNGLLLHIEGRMILSVNKLETSMYYPSLETCLVWHLYLTTSWTKHILITSEVSPILIGSCQMYERERIFIDTSFTVTVCFMKTFAFHALEMHRKQKLRSQQHAGELKGFSLIILPSVLWDEYLWHSSIFS